MYIPTNLQGGEIVQLFFKHPVQHLCGLSYSPSIAWFNRIVFLKWIPNSHLICSHLNAHRLSRGGAVAVATTIFFDQPIKLN